MSKFFTETTTGRKVLKRYAEISNDTDLLEMLQQLEHVLEVKRKLSKPLSFKEEVGKALATTPDISFALEKLPITTAQEVYLYSSILKETRQLHRMYSGKEEFKVPVLVFPEEICEIIEAFGVQDFLVDSSMWSSKLESGVTYYHLNFYFDGVLLMLYVRPDDPRNDITFDFRSSISVFSRESSRFVALARESSQKINTFSLEKRLEIFRSIIFNIDFYANLDG